MARRVKGGTLAECVLESCTPIILNRVSTSEQKKNLPVQIAENLSKVKGLGFKKTPVVITAQESGAASYRKTLREAMKLVTDNPRKKYILFVRDVPRFSRDVIDGEVALKELNDAGIPVVILDAGNLYLDGALDNYASKMLFDILLTVAASGKSSELLASLAGTAAAQEKGVYAGAVKDLYSQLANKKGGIHRRVWDSRNAIKAGTLTNKELTRQLNMTSPTTVRQMREFLEAMEIDFGTKQVEEYLDVIDAIIAAEKRHGIGSRKRVPMTNRARALHRVTVGYLRHPNRFPRPDTVGNPATAVKQTDQATGTIADVIANYTRYFVAKT